MHSSWRCSVPRSGPRRWRSNEHRSHGQRTTHEVYTMTTVSSPPKKLLKTQKLDGARRFPTQKTVQDTLTSGPLLQGVGAELCRTPIGVIRCRSSLRSARTVLENTTLTTVLTAILTVYWCTTHVGSHEATVIVLRQRSDRKETGYGVLRQTPLNLAGT